MLLPVCNKNANTPSQNPLAPPLYINLHHCSHSFLFSNFSFSTFPLYLGVRVLLLLLLLLLLSLDLGVRVVHLEVGDDDGDGEGDREDASESAQGTDEHPQVRFWNLSVSCQTRR